MPQLEFQDVTYQSGEKIILSGLSLAVESGEAVTIVGPSGSGKSTFLKLCCHLISPTEGTMRFNGNPFEEFSPVELRKRISYCFQTPVLFGETVGDNIRFPFSIRRKAVDQDRVGELFDRFQMNSSYLKQSVQSLSGGEKQRIALIRTLLFRPDILLLDEVTSALDAANTEIVESVISSVNREGVTVLWVTHNLEQSRRQARRRLTIESGKIKFWEVFE